MVCDCGRPARPVKVCVNPGAEEPLIVVEHVCDLCYERDAWAEVDLSIPHIAMRLGMRSNSFGDQLREFRERAQHSLETLAKDSGINATVLRRLECQEADWLHRSPSGPRPLQPCRDQVIRIGLALYISIAEVNALLMLAGYAPLDTQVVGVPRLRRVTVPPAVQIPMSVESIASV